MKKIIIVLAIATSSPTFASDSNPFLPYHEPNVKILQQEDCAAPALAAMQIAEKENSAESTLTYIMTVDGIDYYLDSKTNEYIEKKK